MEILSQFLEVIMWPVVAIVGIFLLRKPLSELINGVTDFNIGGKNGVSARVNRGYANISSNTKKELNIKDDINKLYFSNKKSGRVTFDYSNNNGVYTIGEGDERFDTMWTKASDKYIHFYNDKPSIKSVRLATDTSELDNVEPNKYDLSSRARTAGLGQIAIFENIHGKFLVTKILDIKDNSRGDPQDELTFDYRIID